MNIETPKDLFTRRINFEVPKQIGYAIQNNHGNIDQNYTINYHFSYFDLDWDYLHDFFEEFENKQQNIKYINEWCEEFWNYEQIAVEMCYAVRSYCDCSSHNEIKNASYWKHKDEVHAIDNIKLMASFINCIRNYAKNDSYNFACEKTQKGLSVLQRHDYILFAYSKVQNLDIDFYHDLYMLYSLMSKFNMASLQWKIAIPYVVNIHVDKVAKMFAKHTIYE